MRKLILVSFISRFGSALFNFAVILLLSQYLGPGGKGIATQLLITISAIQVLSDFMGGGALVFLSSRNTILSLLIPTWIWSFSISILAMPFLALFLRNQFEVYGFHIAAIAFLSAVFNQHLHVLNGREKFQLVNLLTILQSVILASFLWIFLSISKTPLAYSSAMYLAWGIPLFFSIYSLNKLPKTINSGTPEKLKTGQSGKMPELSLIQRMVWLFNYCSTNQLAHLLQFANQRLTFFLLPLIPLGIYSNSVSLSESIWMVSTSIASIQYGKIANSINRSDSILLTTQLVRITLILSSLSALLLVMMPSSVFVFCFGNGFETVKGNLIYLLPGTLCMSGYLIIGHYFSGTGQFAKNNIAIAGGLLVTVICFVFLYFNGKHPLSAHEAALITSCSQMATFFSVIWLFKVDTQIHLSDLLPGPNDLIRFSKLIGLNRNK